MPIRITSGLALNEQEIAFRFIHASGPGGQNVNKVATAVQLRFDVRASPTLPEAMKARLSRLAGQRLTRDGVLVITAQRFRSQERNREDALERLVSLLREAATPPRKRVPTRPSLGERRRRLEAKTARAEIKQQRGRVKPE